MQKNAKELKYGDMFLYDDGGRAQVIRVSCTRIGIVVWFWYDGRKDGMLCEDTDIFSLI